MDEGLWAARPDLMLTGRTLMGHESAKNQQLEDHYFGTIPTRVMAFMKDLEIRVLQVGHPGQDPPQRSGSRTSSSWPRSIEETNLANDHNLLLMSVMRKVARRHYVPRAAAREAFQGRQRQRKAQQLVVGDRHGRQSAQLRVRPPGDNLQLHRIRGQRDDGRSPSQRTAQGFNFQRDQRPPSGRQRGASRNHLDLFGQHSSRSYSTAHRADRL